MKFAEEIIDWLLDGDPAIAYQTMRDILESPERKQRAAQREIARRGWGKAFLERQNQDGHWGRGAYQPKWICTHYTLMDLKTLGIDRANSACRKAADLLLASRQGVDGGLNYARTVEY